MIIWAMLPLICICFIYLLTQKNIKKIIGACCLAITALFLFWGLKQIDTHSYSTPEWQDYTEYNSVRGQLLDHGFPDYEENQEVYKQLGMQKEDVQYYSNWNFADPQIFNVESISKLVALQQDTKEQMVDKKDFVRVLTTGYTKYGWMPLFLISFLMLVFIKGKEKYFLGAQILNFILIQWYLYAILNRYLQQRVDISVAFAIVCVNLWVIIKNCENCSKEKCIGLITICSVLITTYIANSYEYIQYDNEDSDYSAGMMEDDEHLYCNLVNGSKDEIINDIWYRSGKLAKKKHTMAMGGTTTYIPWDAEAMNNFSIVNPYEQCIDNEQVYIVGENMIDATVAYIQRHYNMGAYACLVKKIDGRAVYKIKTDQFDLNIENMVYNSEELKSKESYEINDQTCKLVLEAYLQGENSYLGEGYAEIQYADGTSRIYQMTQYTNDEYDKNSKYRYSKYLLDADYINGMTVNYYYKYHDQVYYIKTVVL